MIEHKALIVCLFFCLIFLSTILFVGSGFAFIKGDAFRHYYMSRGEYEKLEELDSTLNIESSKNYPPLFHFLSKPFALNEPTYFSFIILVFGFVIPLFFSWYLRSWFFSLVYFASGVFYKVLNIGAFPSFLLMYLVLFAMLFNKKWFWITALIIGLFLHSMGVFVLLLAWFVILVLNKKSWHWGFLIISMILFVVGFFYIPRVFDFGIIFLLPIFVWFYKKFLCKDVVVYNVVRRFVIWVVCVFCLYNFVWLFFRLVDFYGWF